MRTLLSAALVASAFAASPALAKNLSLPEDAPVMSAVLPDNWKPSATERGMEATSPKGDVYTSVEFASDITADLAALMRANGKWMRENKIIPVSANTHDRDFLLNGNPAHEITYDARDKDGSTKVTYVLVELPNDSVGVVTIWATDKQRAGQAKTLEGIMDSVKAIK